MVARPAARQCTSAREGIFTSHSNRGVVHGGETAVGEGGGKSRDRESIVTERWGLKDHSREERRRGEQKPQGRKSAQQPSMPLAFPYTLLSITPLAGCCVGLVTMSTDTVGLARPMT